jgi:hypothetical protein
MSSLTANPQYKNPPLLSDSNSNRPRRVSNSHHLGTHRQDFTSIYFQSSAASSRPINLQPFQLQKNLQVLDSFLDLNYNWDFDGAEPFSPSLIKRAKAILTSLSQQPSVVNPTMRDSVQFEYEKPGKYLEFEIYEDKVVFLYMHGEKHEQGLIQDDSDYNQLTARFYARP